MTSLILSIQGYALYHYSIAYNVSACQISSYSVSGHMTQPGVIQKAIIQIITQLGVNQKATMQYEYCAQLPTTEICCQSNQLTSNNYPMICKTVVIFPVLSNSKY